MKTRGESGTGPATRGQPARLPCTLSRSSGSSTASTTNNWICWNWRSPRRTDFSDASHSTTSRVHAHEPIEHHFYPCAFAGGYPPMRTSTPTTHQFRGTPGLVNRPQRHPNYVPMMPIWSAHTSGDVHGQCAANLTPNATPGCLKMKTSPGWSGHNR